MCGLAVTLALSPVLLEVASKICIEILKDGRNLDWGQLFEYNCWETRSTGREVLGTKIRAQGSNHTQVLAKIQCKSKTLLLLQPLMLGALS